MIRCQQYDYLELVCLYQYPLAITLKSGDILCGTALDVAPNENKVESLKLLSNNNVLWVNLEDIAILTVTAQNPHLTEVTFV
jgi:Rho-binding antiterminator